MSIFCHWNSQCKPQACLTSEVYLVIGWTEVLPEVLHNLYQTPHINHEVYLNVLYYLTSDILKHRQLFHLYKYPYLCGRNRWAVVSQDYFLQQQERSTRALGLMRWIMGKRACSMSWSTWASSRDPVEKDSSYSEMLSDNYKGDINTLVPARTYARAHAHTHHSEEKEGTEEEGDKCPKNLDAEGLKPSLPRAGWLQAGLGQANQPPSTFPQLQTDHLQPIQFYSQFHFKGINF